MKSRIVVVVRGGVAYVYATKEALTDVSIMIADFDVEGTEPDELNQIDDEDVNVSATVYEDDDFIEKVFNL